MPSGEVAGRVQGFLQGTLPSSSHLLASALSSALQAADVVQCSLGRLCGWCTASVLLVAMVTPLPDTCSSTQHHWGKAVHEAVGGWDHRWCGTHGRRGKVTEAEGRGNVSGGLMMHGGGGQRLPRPLCTSSAPHSHSPPPSPLLL